MMEAFALYLFKSVVWLTGFTLVYLLFLKNERYFLLNRIYLLAGTMASILFPLFTWHYTVLIPVTPTVEVSDLQMMGVISEPEPFPTQTLLYCLYLAGALYLLLRLIRQTLTVVGVIRKSEILPYRSAKLIRTADYPASFSFFSFVFVNPSICDTETNEIVNHEMEHIRQHHWIDLMLFEVLCTLQWFNPLSWLYGRFIRQNHEYLADQHALQRAANPAIYRAALINQLFGGEVITLANSFNYSINKKRFHMMKNTINPPVRKLKLLLILPIIAGVFYAFATPEYRYTNGTEDQKPAYSITQDNIQIPFTNQLTKADLEAIKSDLEKVGLQIDYHRMNFTNEGKLKALSATVNTNPGSVSFESKELSPYNFPLFRMNPDGAFGIYYQTKINGTVYKPDGSPLPGAAVIINGDNQSVGTVTNQDGEFELSSVPRGSDIVIANAGYQTVTIKADTDKPIIVNMKEATTGTDDQPDMTTIKGNFSTITSTNPAPGFIYNAKNIQGISRNGANVLKGENIAIDMGNTNSLVYIDGHESTNTEANKLNPENIESISVLKGNSAFSKYGDNGKKGVVEITMKREKSGNKNAETFTTMDGRRYTIIGESARTQKDSEVYTEVEEMPEFPGGHEGLSKFIGENIKYPAAAMQNGIQGKVYIKFVVDKTGKAVDAKVVMGVEASLDQEALRVVNLLPTWKPGRQGGKDVAVEYTIPINFVLQGDKINDKPAGSENTVYTAVQVMPEFPGGNDALSTYIRENLKYPAIAAQKGIQGKVIVNFVVTKTGKITHAKVVTAVDPLLDQEAIRVIESMPDWKPGNNNGEDVDVGYGIPINFVLETKAQPQAETSVQKGKLLIVPNPTQSQATVTLEGSNYSDKLEVSLFDSYGKQLRKESKNGPSFTLSVSSLTPGNYVVITNDGSKQYQGNLVVNH